MSQFAVYGLLALWYSPCLSLTCPVSQGLHLETVQSTLLCQLLSYRVCFILEGNNMRNQGLLPTPSILGGVSRRAVSPLRLQHPLDSSIFWGGGPCPWAPGMWPPHSSSLGITVRSAIIYFWIVLLSAHGLRVPFLYSLLIFMQTSSYSYKLHGAWLSDSYSRCQINIYWINVSIKEDFCCV